jgi:hypothetical protein
MTYRYLIFGPDVLGLIKYASEGAWNSKEIMALDCFLGPGILSCILPSPTVRNQALNPKRIRKGIIVLTLCFK